MNPDYHVILVKHSLKLNPLIIDCPKYIRKTKTFSTNTILNIGNIILFNIKKNMTKKKKFKPFVGFYYYIYIFIYIILLNII